VTLTPDGLIKLSFSICLRKEGYYGLYFRENYSNCLYRITVTPAELSLKNCILLLPDALKPDYNSVVNTATQISEILCVKSKATSRSKEVMKQEKEDCIMKFGTDCFVYSSFDHNYENPSYRKEKKLEFEIWRNPGSRILQVEVCRRMTDNIY
jgi:hypothetical protein